MNLKRVGVISTGAVLIIVSIILLAISPWVQRFSLAHIAPFSIGVGLLVRGLIPSWWR